MFHDITTLYNLAKFGNIIKKITIAKFEYIIRKSQQYHNNINIIEKIYRMIIVFYIYFCKGLFPNSQQIPKHRTVVSIRLI